MLLSSLRQHILDRAIRGQLVPQLPEEGTAEELYQQIQAEKQALIANGTIKKEKPLEPIQEEDIPFEIPATWKWVRLGDCFDVCTGKTPSKSETKNYEPAQVAFFKPADIQNGSHISSCAEQVSELGALEAPNFPSGSILVNCIGHIGKCAITDIGGICNQQINAILPRSVCNMQFVLYVMQSTDVLQQENRLATATTISILNKNNFRTIIIPLPPLPEQNRIVRKAEALFSALDSLESSKKRISAIQTELTKRILDQAIQGKLVPQRPEEGTAEELYQQIQAEKKQLITTSAIKKEKSLPPIEEKDLPFDIPETWKWVRLGDVCHILFSGKPPQYDKVNKHHPCLGQAANQIEGIRMSEAKYVTSAFFNTVPEYQKLRFGDVLLNTLGGGTIGRSGIFNIQDTDFITDGHIFVFRMFDLCTAQYLLAYLRHNLDSIIKGAEGSTNQTFLKKSEVLNYVFPLPPLAEQKLIVAKIEEMLTICKTLQ